MLKYHIRGRLYYQLIWGLSCFLVYSIIFPGGVHSGIYSNTPDSDGPPVIISPGFGDVWNGTNTINWTGVLNILNGAWYVWCDADGLEPWDYGVAGGIYEDPQPEYWTVEWDTTRVPNGFWYIVIYEWSADEPFNVDPGVSGLFEVRNIGEPHIFDIDLWEQSDPTQTSLLNTDLTVGNNYTFFVDGNYIINSIDKWENAEVNLLGWYDNKKSGTDSSPYSTHIQFHRTRQFEFYYVAKTNEFKKNYPSGFPWEFCKHSYWEDPNIYGSGEFRHHIYLNITIKKQTWSANGGLFANGSATSGNIWSKTSSLNDPDSWDLRIKLHNHWAPIIKNVSYEEFGILPNVTISVEDNPTAFVLSVGDNCIVQNPSNVTYSANTNYWVNVTVSDLMRNGIGPEIIPANNVGVANNHTWSASKYSEIYGADWPYGRAFLSPGSKWCVWGNTSWPYVMKRPYNGTTVSGPGGTDYYANLYGEPVDFTEVWWWITVPPDTLEGSYWTNITYTIETIDTETIKPIMISQTTRLIVNVYSDDLPSWPIDGYVYQYDGNSTNGYDPKIVSNAEVKIEWFNTSLGMWDNITTIADSEGYYSGMIYNSSYQDLIFCNVTNNPQYRNFGYNYSKIMMDTQVDIICGIPYDLQIHQPIHNNSYQSGSLIDIEYSIVDRDGVICPGYFTYEPIGEFNPRNWDKQGLVIDTDTIDDERYARCPCVIKQKTTYKMWYEGRNSTNYNILYATSENGIEWNKQGIILNASGQDESKHVRTPCVIFDEDIYKMWYSGTDNDIYRIFYATSADGVNWIKQGLVLDVGGQYQNDDVMSPCVLRVGNNYKMWYQGFDGSNWRIFYANSTDGINWIKYGLVMDYGDIWREGSGVRNPWVIKTHNEYQMWYTGRGMYAQGTFRLSILYANSVDGINWDKKDVALTFGDFPVESDSVSEPTVIRDTDGLYKMWYSGTKFDPTEVRILYATSRYYYSNYPINISLIPTSTGPINYLTPANQTFDGTESNDPGHFWGTIMVNYPYGEYHVNVSEGGIEDYDNFLTQWNKFYIDPQFNIPGYSKDWNNISININASSYNIDLQEGWNLISTPLIQSNTQIDYVLENISGKWNIIQSYYPLEESPWKSNCTFKPYQLNDLEDLNHKMAFWINITEPDLVLYLFGELPTMTTIPLYAGWNLVGYPSLNTETVANALWGTGADRVEKFDAMAPYRISEVGPSYVMKPGEGYWIHVPADSVWIIDW